MFRGFTSDIECIEGEHRQRRPDTYTNKEIKKKFYPKKDFVWKLCGTGVYCSQIEQIHVKLSQRLAF